MPGGTVNACRQRDAIYGYLTAVYDLVIWWAAEQRDVERARRALCSRRLDVREREDPFAAIIRCTADPARVDERTRSKWSRVMRYATAVKDQDEPFQAVRGAKRRHQQVRFSLRPISQTTESRCCQASALTNSQEHMALRWAKNKSCK